jgi:hypothetical protein
MMREKKVRKEKYRKKKAQAAREHPLKSRLAKKDIPKWPDIFQKISASFLHVVAAPPKN